MGDGNIPSGSREKGGIVVNTTAKETVINIRAPAARRILINHGAEIAINNSHRLDAFGKQAK
jgi:hypothetical protein